MRTLLNRKKLLVPLVASMALVGGVLWLHGQIARSQSAPEVRAPEAGGPPPRQERRTETAGRILVIFSGFVTAQWLLFRRSLRRGQGDFSSR